MNSALLCRWLSFPCWLRMLALVVVLGAGMLGIRQLWQRPLQQQLTQLAQQQRQEQQRYRALLQNLLQRDSPRETAAEIARLQQKLRPEASAPFSLPQLSRAAGDTLQGWQPLAQGGELTLALDWPQLQALFHYLSERQPEVKIPRFSLKRVNERLLLKLVLHYER